MTDYRVVIFSGTRRNHSRLRRVVVRELNYEQAHARGCGQRLFVAVGDCPTGVDGYVRGWCSKNLPDTDWRVHEADWAANSRGAGPIRNRAMCRAHRDAECLVSLPASWERDLSKGTWDCVDAAIELGIHYRVIEPEEWR